MTPTVRKYAIFFLVFGIWYALDLWTKAWADDHLADPYHPIAVKVAEADAGKTVDQVLAGRLGVPAEDAAGTARHVRRLGEPLKVQPSDSVFAPEAPGSRYYGFYVFWRGDDTTPRRLDKVELILVPRWLKLAKPAVDPARIQEAVGGHLSSITWADWLAERLRVVDPEDAAEIIAHGIYPVERQPQRMAAQDVVSAGELLLVEHRRIDVMGEWEYDARGTPVSPPWFQFVYAENTGAAFGFMKGLPPDIRGTLFFLLTMLAFGVILTITAKIPPSAWTVYVGLAAILGGAAGNFTDRMRYGYVIDFIDMDLGFMHWPTYNVADIAIAVGVILLIGDMLFNKNSPLVKEPPKDAKEAKAEGGEASTATA